MGALVRLRPKPGEDTRTSAWNPLTRRRVLTGGGAALAAFVGLRVDGGRGSARESRAEAVIPTPTVTPSVDGASVSVPGVTPFIVANDDFYRIDTALVIPQLDTGSWSLRVWGEVEQEVTIDWATLLKQPLEQHLVTLTCVSNEVGGDLVGNALWTGWPVRKLLAMARPKPGADMVLSRSSDGFTAGTPIEALTDDRNAMIAVGMNGQALPFEHGFPARLVVPGLYGYVSATKWVTELKVTRFDQDEGYWTPRGWSAKGPIKTHVAHRRPPGRSWDQRRDGRHRRRRVGAAPRDHQGRGPGRRRTVAAGHAGRRADRRRLAAVVPAVGGDAGNAPAPGPRDRRHGRHPDGPAGAARPGRRDGLARGPGRGLLGALLS